MNITPQTSLNEIALIIKQKHEEFNGSLEAVSNYLHGRDASGQMIAGEQAPYVSIARHILTFGNPLWKDSFEQALRNNINLNGAAPTARVFAAGPARTIISMIEDDVERQRRAQDANLQANAAANQPPVQTDFISLGRAAARRALGRCAYSFDADIWYWYDGRKWDVDPAKHKINQEVETFLLEAMRAFQATGNQQALNDCKSAARSVGNIVQRCASYEGLSIARGDFDGCADCINTPELFISIDSAGGLDTEPPNDLHYCTLQTFATPAKKWEEGCVWDEFLKAVFPREEDRYAIQRMCGYVLMGSKQDKAVFFLKGDTNTGKSTFLNAVENALGTYSITSNVNVWLMNSKNEYAMADYVGKRLITLAEFDEEMRVNNTLIKSFTGGEIIEARQIYGKPFRYRPQGTIIITTNKMPFLGNDKATWARVYLLEVDGTPLDWDAEKDGDWDLSKHRFSWEREDMVTSSLSRKLQSEEVAGQILRWMLDGVRDYIAEGLNWKVLDSNDKLEEEKMDQRHHADIFIDEFCSKSPAGDWTPISEIYGVYRTWAQNEEGIQESKLLTKSGLARKLRSAGFDKNPHKGDGSTWNVTLFADTPVGTVDPSHVEGTVTDRLKGVAALKKMSKNSKTADKDAAMEAYHATKDNLADRMDPD